MPGLLDMLNAGEDPLAGASPGLLSPEQEQAARRQALLTGAAQLMSAGGWSPQRTTFGQALGPAIMAGQQAQSQAINSSLQQALLAKQLKEKKADLVAVIGPDGKPQYVEASKAAGMQPYSMVSEAKDTAPIQEYNLYVAQAKAAGKQPLAYLDFLTERAKSNAQYPYSIENIGGVPTRVNRTGGYVPPANQPAPQPAPGPQPLSPPVITTPTPTTQPLSTLDKEADAKRKLAGAEAGGRTTGEKVAGAEFDLPRVTDTVNQALVDINQLRSHPGLQYITGMYSKAPVIPGTAQASAQALADQVAGQTFLQAYQQLKGGGAITEIEGNKATQAIARLKQAQSTEDYQKGLDELAGILRTGLERAQGQARKPKSSRSREDILRQYGVGP